MKKTNAYDLIVFPNCETCNKIKSGKIPGTYDGIQAHRRWHIDNYLLKLAIEAELQTKNRFEEQERRLLEQR